MKKIVHGIDLGTSNSCIARFVDGRFEIIPIDGREIVPSVVAFDGENWLVGQEAKNYGQFHPTSMARSVKRKMGEEHFFYSIGGKQYSPVELSSRILSYLKQRAENAHGDQVKDVVVTVPAWFNENQRKATLEAATKADLNVLVMINEPTAASLAYESAGSKEFDSNRSSAGGADKEVWLVYDLGGGTFDVSIISVDNEYKEVLASCGNVYLGGDDFDKLIEKIFIDELKSKYSVDVSGDIAAIARLSKKAEEVKIDLSTQVNVYVSEVFSFNGKTLELEMNFARQQFDDLIRHYIDSTLDKVQQALDEAGVEASEVSKMLLVGGSTRIPLVADALYERFGLRADCRISADTSVALGAAIKAALSKGLTYAQVIVDVAPHDLGVAAVGKHDDLSYLVGADELPRYPYTFTPIIRKNTRIPTRFVKEFFTGVDNQEQVEICVFQGESELTTENVFVDSFFVDLEPMSSGSSLYVGFEYDASGMVKVSVASQGVNTNHDIKLSQSGTVGSGPGNGTSSVNSPMNFLIEQVLKRIDTVESKEQERIGAVLEQYKRALAVQNDADMDRLEEELYEWLESSELNVGNL